MAGGVSDAGMPSAERAEPVTGDTDLPAGLIRKLFAGHAASFRCPRPARVNGYVPRACLDPDAPAWTRAPEVRR
jgi:hypothetical protein